MMYYLLKIKLMKEKKFKDEIGELKVEFINDNLKKLSAYPKKGIFCPDVTYLTNYPIELIQKIFYLKGSCWVIDEIKRDESPDYLQRALNFGIFSFLDEKNFKNKTLLDFGCGSGASASILGRSLKDPQIIGVELDSKLLEIAEMRKKYHSLEKKVLFIESKDPKTIPIKKKVDFILLSAVYEHLLPKERENILKLCWQILEKNGIIFVNQTPNRWVFYENHTTNLFFVNYLPDKICYWISKKFSKRNLKDFSWNELLRMGIRGATEKEISNILSRFNEFGSVEILKPSRLGLKNKIDVWYRSTSTFSKKSKLLKTIIWYFLKTFPFMEKILLPGIVMAIKKK